MDDTSNCFQLIQSFYKRLSDQTIELNPSAAIRPRNAYSHKLEKKWSKVEVISQSEDSTINPSTLDRIFSIKLLKDDTIEITDRICNRKALKSGALTWETRNLSSKCPICKADIELRGVHFVKDIELMILICKCATKTTEGKITSKDCKVAIFKDGVCKGILGKPIYRYLVQQETNEFMDSDVIWHSRRKVYFREMGTCKLVEYRLSDLRRGVLNKGSLSKLGLPKAKIDKKVQHFWVNSSGSRWVLLWQDNSFCVSNHNKLKLHEGQNDLSTQMIRPMFDKLLLLCSIVKYEDKSKTLKLQFTLYHHDRSKVVSDVQIESNGWSHSMSVNNLIEVRRSLNQVLYLATACCYDVHILQACHTSISVLSQNIRVSDSFIFSGFFLDARQTNLKTVYLAVSKSIKKLNIKFD